MNFTWPAHQSPMTSKGYPTFGLTYRSQVIENPFVRSGCTRSLSLAVPFTRLIETVQIRSQAGIRNEALRKRGSPYRISSRCDPVAPGLEQRQQGSHGRIDADNLWR